MTHQTQRMNTASVSLQPPTCTFSHAPRFDILESGSDWVGTTDMDTQEPAFEDLIIEQAQRHIDRIPSFEGIAIDRLDYSDVS